jgi:hypothetical protein
VRPCQPDVATSAQIKAPLALREATLHPGPQGVLGFELRGFLSLSGGLDGLVVGLQPDGELPWGVFRRGARRTGGTRATRGPVKPDANDRIARDVVPWPPVDTGMTLGTARLLGLPIDDEGLEVIALPFPPLPAVGPERRTDHIDLMLGLRGDQEVRIDIAAVQQVRAREKLSMREVTVDRRAHDAILRGRRRRHDLCDEIRVVGIAGLREMDLRAHPMGLPFTTVARLQVIGRGHAHRRGRLLVSRAPAECFVPWGCTAVILLDPNPTQCLKSREITEAWRALGGYHPVQELIAVRPDLAGERLAFTCILRQAGLVGPEAITRVPCGRHLLAHPGGSCLLSWFSA